jgi:hypothetical protein
MRKKGKKRSANSSQKLVNVTISDWLKLKPYKAATNHDLKYLKLSKEIYKELRNDTHNLKQWGLHRRDFAQLSVMLASYVEDFASEIGIWKAFTDYNKAELGFCVPFFDTEKAEYFENDLNPQDLSYIVWHYVSSHFSDGIFPPNLFEGIGHAIYDLIEPQVETLSVTNFYDKYLTVADDEDFFELKYKLMWFALSSYLIGVDFGKESEKIEEEIDEEIKKLVIKGDYETATLYTQHRGIVLYNAQNRFFYYANSKYGALNTPIWFSMIIQASENAKSKIADFYKYEKGHFQFKSIEKKHYLFEEVRTGRVFEVAKNSFEPSFERDIHVGYYLEMALFYWNGLWFMSGGLQSDNNGKLTAKKGDPISFYLYPEDVKQKAFDLTKGMYELFIELYEKPFVLCKNEKHLEQVITDFTDAHQDKVTKEKNLKVDKKLKPIFNDWNEGKDEDLAVFFHKTKGLTIRKGLNLMTTLLLSGFSDLTREEKDNLFGLFHVDFGSEEFIQYLLTNYPTVNLVPPLGFIIDLKKNGAYLRRFFHPKDYDHFPTPMNAMVDSERLNKLGLL